MLRQRIQYSGGTWLWLVVAFSVGVLAAWSPWLTLMLLVLIAGAIIVVAEPSIALVVMLVVAPLKTLIETEAAINLPLDIGQLAFVAAVGAWALRRLKQRPMFANPLDIPILLPILGFVFAALLSVPGAVSVGAGLNEWLKWVEIVVLIYIVADRQSIRWSWVLSGLILAGVLQALIGIYEFQGGSGAPHLWILDFQFFRAFGTFGQPNPFGAFIGLILPLTLGAAWGCAMQWYQTRRVALLLPLGLLGSAGAMLLVGLFVSWSRGAWMGFGAALVAMLFFLPHRRWQGAVLILIALFVGSVLWATGRIPPQLTQRITSFTEDFTGFEDVRGVVITDENYAVVERLAHWQAALDMAADAPLLGVGFGNYEIAYADYALVNWPDALGHAHNYYLNLLAETGILGITVYVMMLGSVFLAGVRLLPETTGLARGVVLGFLGSWTHLGVHSLVDKLFVNNIFLHIGVLLGLVAVLQLRLTSAKGNSCPN
jgi:putative inorganic carbon (hco3(-)) transporter